MEVQSNFFWDKHELLFGLFSIRVFNGTLAYELEDWETALCISMPSV
jgi:hypothetical protein